MEHGRHHERVPMLLPRQATLTSLIHKLDQRQSSHHGSMRKLLQPLKAEMAISPMPPPGQLSAARE
jgi:hypothetical protein